MIRNYLKEMKEDEFGVIDVFDIFEVNAVEPDHMAILKKQCIKVQYYRCKYCYISISLWHVNTILIDYIHRIDFLHN